MLLIFAVSLSTAAIYMSRPGEEKVEKVYEFYDETEYSATPTVTPSRSPTPTATSSETPMINRASLVFGSTAYTNNEGKRDGVNGDIFFHLVIGQLMGKSPEATGTEGLVRIMSFGIGGDLKYSFFEQARFYPALALGTGLSFWLDAGGDPGGGEIKVGENETFFIRELYAVASKDLGPFSLHAGYKRGRFPRVITMYSRYLRQVNLVAGEEVEVDVPKNSFYTGFDVSLGQVRRFRAEVFLVPDMYREPLLVNTCFDSLMNFNISYLRYYDEETDEFCYSLLGYFNQRFTIYGR